MHFGLCRIGALNEGLEQAKSATVSRTHIQAVATVGYVNQRFKVKALGVAMQLIHLFAYSNLESKSRLSQETNKKDSETTCFSFDAMNAHFRIYRYYIKGRKYPGFIQCQDRSI